MFHRRGVLGFLAGAIAGVAGATYYTLFRRPLPQTRGRIRLSGLEAEVLVVRDRWGIPHLYAHSLRDLFFAQGFVHAQDRFFQMEFQRRLASGRLSEVLGPKALEVDRWMRIVGLRRAADREVATLSDRAREALLAYAEGVNAFLSRGRLPAEFSFLRYRPEHWVIADSLAWLKMMAWMLSINWEAEVLRARLIARLGPERAARLDPSPAADTPTILPPGVDYSRVGRRALDRAEAARPFTGPPAEAGLGSNSWVLSGRHTPDGHPILANDMHLPLQAPSIWYENHLVAGEQLDAVGVSLPGLPGIIVGHNGYVAWGFTATLPDTQDLYIERLHPENSRLVEYQGRWYEAEVYHEEIVIRGGGSVIEEVLVTRHGPIITPLVEAAGGHEAPLALAWPVLQPGRTAEALILLGEARDCESFHEGLRYLEAPVLNVVYADIYGNIGYTLAGAIPRRKPGHTGLVPVPGWTDEYEWEGMIPFDKLPHVINPPEGVIVTANNRPVSEDYPHFLGADWLPGYRAERIREMLEEAHPIGIADCQRIQRDQVSVLAREIGRHLAALTTDDPRLETVIALFQGWDGRLSATSPQAAVYEVFLRRMIYNTFGPEVGDLIHRVAGKGPHPLLAGSSASGWRVRLLLQELLRRPDAPWFAGRSREALIYQSLREAVDFLEATLGPEAGDWQWGRLHRVTFNHPLGRVKPLDRLFNRGGWPLGGDETTPWAAGTSYHDLDTSAMIGPPYRQVIPLGDLSRALAVNAPGQSGHVGSPHYADQVRLWLNGEYRPILYRQEDVMRHSEAVLHLEPR